MSGAGIGASQLILEAGDSRARIDLGQGGRLASLQVSGFELLPGEGADTIHWGSYIVAPWTGRLRGGRFTHAGRTLQMPLSAPPHALHGLVLDRPWDVLDHRGSNHVTLGIDLGPPWPWRGRLVHTLQLWPDRLDARLELRADEPMPAAMGWHPWFSQSAGRSRWASPRAGRARRPAGPDVCERCRGAADGGARVAGRATLGLLLRPDGTSAAAPLAGQVRRRPRARSSTPIVHAGSSTTRSPRRSLWSRGPHRRTRSTCHRRAIVTPDGSPRGHHDLALAFHLSAGRYETPQMALGNPGPCLPTAAAAPSGTAP